MLFAVCVHRSFEGLPITARRYLLYDALYYNNTRKAQEKSLLRETVVTSHETTPPPSRRRTAKNSRVYRKERFTGITSRHRELITASPTKQINLAAFIDLVLRQRAFHTLPEKRHHETDHEHFEPDQRRKHHPKHSPRFSRGKIKISPADLCVFHYCVHATTTVVSRITTTAPDRPRACDVRPYFKKNIYVHALADHAPTKPHTGTTQPSVQPSQHRTQNCPVTLAKNMKKVCLSSRYLRYRYPNRPDRERSVAASAREAAQS